MSSKVPKNDSAWEKIFSEDNVLEIVRRDGFFRISASRINKIREARLMTKFDHSVQLPQIFKDNQLSIQPTSRGEYIIGRFDSYFQLPKTELSNVEYFELDPSITTLDARNIYSESFGLMCAFHSGMITEVLDEDVNFTIFGRMSTGKFTYNIQHSDGIKKMEVEVANSQCEIDAGFEGNNCFGILEVKIGEKDDFIIRQLFYPYRLWAGKTQKKIIPILLSISNDIFSFYIFNFADPHCYNSIQLIDSRHFCIGQFDIQLSDIVQILQTTRVNEEQHSLVFPQADEFPRIIDLLAQMLNASQPLDKESVATEYAFALRQADYYLNAAKYLGLVEESNKEFILTALGISIMNFAPRKRKLMLAERILMQPIFNKVTKFWIDNKVAPDREQVVKVIKSIRPKVSKGREWSDSTVRRRAQTVQAWVRWVLNLSNPDLN